MMRIAEMLTIELSLDWLWRRLPRLRGPFDETLELAHFTLIVNGAVFVFALIVAPSAFLDPASVPGLGTFAVRLLVLSLPIWCLTFGVRSRSILRGSRRTPIRGRRRDLVAAELPDYGTSGWMDRH